MTRYRSFYLRVGCCDFLSPSARLIKFEIDGSDGLKPSLCRDEPENGGSRDREGSNDGSCECDEYIACECWK